MKKHLFLFSIVICLLFVSCSSVRFGHLARVKTFPKNHSKSLNENAVSFKKNDSVKVVSNVSEENILEEKIHSETPSEEIIIPKSKVLKSQNKTLEIPKKEVIKTKKENQNYGNPNRNENAHKAYLYGLLALILQLISIVLFVFLILSFLTSGFLYGILSSFFILTIVAIFCAIQALRLGIKGLREINQEGIGYNRGQAYFGIFIGSLFLIIFLVVLFSY